MIPENALSANKIATLLISSPSTCDEALPVNVIVNLVSESLVIKGNKPTGIPSKNTLLPTAIEETKASVVTFSKSTTILFEIDPSSVKFSVNVLVPKVNFGETVTVGVIVDGSHSAPKLKSTAK